MPGFASIARFRLWMAVADWPWTEDGAGRGERHCQKTWIEKRGTTDGNGDGSGLVRLLLSDMIKPTPYGAGRRSAT
jgi:hypothetical protein